MRRIFVAIPFVLIGMMSTGCAKSPGVGAIGRSTPTVSGHPAAHPPTKAPTKSPSRTPTKTPAPTVASTTDSPHWPSPEDCVSYEPTKLTTHYEAGVFTVLEGTKEVARAQGDPGSNVGAQALALAQRYHKHCFLGRLNTQPDAGQFIFDYWRSPSEIKTTIPDEYAACSPYDPTNLSLEDLGSGGGWRLKDHDHVLHLFASDTDARGGLLVASMYHEICFLGVTTDSDLDQLSYFR